MILAVAVAPGGSDHSFWAAVIGEVEGKPTVLTPPNVRLNVQGGLYLGYLNKQLYEWHTKNWSQTTGSTGHTGTETLFICLSRSSQCPPCSPWFALAQTQSTAWCARHIGCGLVVWSFVWDDGAHYDRHPYEIEVYTWQAGRLIPQQKYESERKYLGNGAAALGELGIRAQDQRAAIVKVKRYIE